MTWFRFFDLFFRSLLQLMGPTPLAATSLVQQLEAKVDPARAGEARPVSACPRASLSGARRALACRLSRRTVPRSGAQHGIPVLQYPVSRRSSPAPSSMRASHERALELRDAGAVVASGTVHAHHEPLMLMVEAYARLAAHEQGSREGAAGQALDAQPEQEQSAASFRWLVTAFRRLLALALVDGIETEYARALIAEFAITAESADIEAWPWPIRIRTLGGFALAVDGAPLRIGAQGAAEAARAAQSSHRAGWKGGERGAAQLSSSGRTPRPTRRRMRLE